MCLRGVTYNGDTDLRDRELDCTRTLLRSNNVFDAMLNFEDVQYVVAERVAEKQFLLRGDLLVCMANGSKALVGKAALIEDNYPNLTFGAFMGCLRPFHQNDGLYLSFLSQTHSYRAQISDILSGSTINNLSPKQIEGLTFLIPESNERVAIATCLHDIDEEIRRMVGANTKLRLLKTGMMQQLLTGKIRLV